MKHGNANYLQLSRLIFNEEPYKSLSRNAKWLYVVLKELEHRFTGKEQRFFWRTNGDLAQEAGFSERTLDRARAELLKTDLVQSWKGHFIFNNGKPEQKMSEKHVTCYQILK